MEPGYFEKISHTRQKRDERVKANPLNWLSLVGLFPLQEGINTLGGDFPGNINIPGLKPENSASFIVEGESVRFQPLVGEFLMNGLPPGDKPLRKDVDGDPDLVQIGSFAMRVIQRGEDLYLRVWDEKAAMYMKFIGFHYYEVNPAWCLEAEYKEFDSPRIGMVTNMLGLERESNFSGLAKFSVNGISCSLIAEEDEGELLFSFVDQTRLDTTYPGGRYLEVPKPAGNRLTLDFNLAVNWPCAYTPYATCPLPPPENHLPIRVEAGEKRYPAG